MAERNSTKRNPTFGLYIFLGAVILGVAGIGHAALQSRINAVLAVTTEPREPLDSIAHQLGDWAGSDRGIADEILQIATFDDFWLNRMYSHSDGSQASVFIGYVGRPRAHIGHRPDVCYAASGWTQLSEERLTIPSEDAAPIEAVLYTFEEPSDRRRHLRVLATYLVNGQYTNDAAKFTGWNQRQVDIFGIHQPAYIARVQVAMAGQDDESELPLLKDLSKRLSEALIPCMPVLDPANG